MKALVIHPKTERDIKELISSKPQAALIIGTSGIGKKSLSRGLAEELLKVSNLDVYPYVLTIKTEEKSIGIENIRRIEHFLSLKVPNLKSPNRVIIIEDAEKLTLEAQNALLKTLEEPPQDSLILLTLSHLSLILPTLRSRAQKLYLVPPDETSLRNFYRSADKDEFNLAYLVSGGLPGLMQAFLDNQDHPLKAATIEARALLSKNLYERSLMVNDLAKDANKLLNILQVLEQMATISLSRGANPIKWQRVLKGAHEARVSLSKNAQAKLTLLRLMFSL